MPWVNQELCIGCSLCVRECPVDAITMTTDTAAEIDDERCIRCGHCHGICPQEAVRHDGERIPLEVAENLRWVRGLLEHYTDPREQSAFMQRMTRFFNKQKTVCDQTLTALASTVDDPAEAMDQAIEKLAGPDTA